MKVSFVIPAYNEEQLIGKCLGSIEREIERSGYEAEVIVADNGSTDKTKEVAARFPHVRVVEEHWKGANRARQAGFKASTGEYIASLDADVVVPPGWLTRAMHEFERNPKLVAVSGPFILYDLSPFHRFLARSFYVVGYIVYVIVRFLFRRGSMIQGGNILLRRDALEKIGGHNTDIEFYGDDTDTARRLSKVGNVKFTFKLPISTSGRRLKHEGIVRIGLRYALNYFWVVIFGKPYTRAYKDVRPADKGDRRELNPN
ncbi:hypothetical protein A2853_03200 [Candidatus Kaiserbacteria bacterium RIFCSPHIGHO2_01_FULL_55_17]|uniref:Glycosyltransferase 2-like domain-containing protein n=1 Tax=Candidatus Kaiserbacteria bacterium RIFCSPHIGHO2_01_FULL_55_17 TaxID=1798484 RepID=A0A1F6DA56_9BACT|nr:MAG: hypothetical protein A2853_03200 [Candidatus Kaiserbacteria bacterium RIFCSPHIGHO2_01_FULL_55_17]